MKMQTLTMGGLIAAAAIAGATPLFAQSAPEEIVVTGRYGTVPDSVRTLSHAVSYADLDLSTQAGRDELRRRINLTSRWLCEKLGETETSGPAASCRQDATNSAMQRVGTIEQSFAPRGTTWARGPAWQPPYPADWAGRYP
jgi:UrcA family protein